MSHLTPTPSIPKHSQGTFAKSPVRSSAFSPSAEGEEEPCERISVGVIFENFVQCVFDLADLSQTCLAAFDVGQCKQSPGNLVLLVDNLDFYFAGATAHILCECQDKLKVQQDQKRDFAGT